VVNDDDKCEDLLMKEPDKILASDKGVRPYIVAVYRKTFPFGLGITRFSPVNAALIIRGRSITSPAGETGANRPPQRGGDRAWTVPPPEDFPRRLIAAGPR
jgi:hypothetical protein